jgi:sec-independent protein translocase protein TatB
MELFGISFENMLLILLVALIIFGPERLPEIAGKIGRWVNDFRRMSTEVRQEVSQEFKLNEFQKLKSEVTEIAQETRKEIMDLKSEVTEIASDTKKDLNEIKSDVKSTLPYDQSFFSVADNNKSNENEPEKAKIIADTVEETAYPVSSSPNGAVFSPFAAAVGHSNIEISMQTQTETAEATGTVEIPVATATKAVNWKTALRGNRATPVSNSNMLDYSAQEQYFGKRTNGHANPETEPGLKEE